MKALRDRPQPLVDLFNHFAVPYHQWQLCIELVHASDGVDMTYVQQLWDLYLKQVSKASITRSFSSFAKSGCWFPCHMLHFDQGFCPAAGDLTPTDHTCCARATLTALDIHTDHLGAQPPSPATPLLALPLRRPVLVREYSGLCYAMDPSTEQPYNVLQGAMLAAAGIQSQPAPYSTASTKCQEQQQPQTHLPWGIVFTVSKH